MLGILIKQERLQKNISQELLCKNICTTSYLSKVENAHVVCSDEIYTQLLQKLGINYLKDESMCQELVREFENILRFLRSEGCCRLEDTSNPISSLCETLLFSKMCIKAFLLDILKKIHSDSSKTSEKEMNSMDFLLPFLDDDERLIFYYSKALYYQKIGNTDKGIQMFKIIESANEPWTYHGIGFCCYKLEKNQQAIEKYQLAYDGYSKIGAVLGMLDVAICLMVVNCAIQNFEEIQKWARIVEQINFVAKDSDIKCAVLFNFGATFMQYNDLDQAILYLEKCANKSLEENLPFYKTLSHLYLAFAYSIKREQQKAKKVLIDIQEEKALNQWAKFIEIIYFILENSDYLQCSTYCTLLEKGIEEAQMRKNNISVKFYQRYLLEAYKQQRKYKNATHLLEQFKLS